MKRLLLILLFSAAFYGFACADVTIDKENCTVTKDGRTFPLYGRVKIVDDYPDITIRLTTDYADIEAKIVNGYPSCCEFVIVDDYPDVKIKIVDDYSDLVIKIVDDYPYIRQTSKVIGK